MVFKICLIFGILAFCQAENLLTVSDRAKFYNDVNITEDGDNWVFSSHGIPDHDHGPFPNEDNPNEVKEQEHVYHIPKSPTIADTPGCLNMGTIGIALNGIPFFNPYSGQGYNAVEGDNREIFDDCDGHPAPRGDYHYHKLPRCLYKNSETMQLLGIALDGYPIYNNIAKDGSILTSADLDLCHGHEVDGIYGYVITTDFPYIMGCYRGVTIERERPRGGDGDGSNRPPPGEDDQRQPPPGGMGGCEIPCYANVSQPEGCPRNPGPTTEGPSDIGAGQVHVFSLCTTLLMLMVALFQ